MVNVEGHDFNEPAIDKLVGLGKCAARFDLNGLNGRKLRIDYLDGCGVGHGMYPCLSA